MIRNRLKGAIPTGRVLHAYVPDVYGKEKRKRKAGKEGKLGVEGMPPEVLLSALRAAGATFEGEGATVKENPVTHADLLDLGLIGAGKRSAPRCCARWRCRSICPPRRCSTCLVR